MNVFGALTRTGLTLLCGLHCLSLPSAQVQKKFPAGFVELNHVDSSITQTLFYASKENLTGMPLPGMFAPSCVLTEEAAQALKKVQQKLQHKGWGLRVFDCYRPKKSFDALMAWAEQKSVLGQAMYYPYLEKRALTHSLFFLEKSLHDQGNAVSVGIEFLPTAKKKNPVLGKVYQCCLVYHENHALLLDFGSGFDCLAPQAQFQSTLLTESQKWHQQFLRHVMVEEGFLPSEVQWWEFVFKTSSKYKHHFDVDVY